MIVPEETYASSVITEEIKNLIGVEYTFCCEVEKGAIRKVAQAIGDPNPLWQDEEYAKKARYGGIIAPPSFFNSFGFADVVCMYVAAECPLKTGVNGEYEVEYYQPIKPGDIITMVIKLVDVKEKEGKKGKLLVMTIDLVCRNQRGEMVVKLQNTVIRL